MTLSKKEQFSSLWIQAKDRLPDPTVHKHILTYNEHSGLINNPFTFVVKDIVDYMHRFWAGTVQRPSGCICALEITHWMPLYPPTAQSKDFEHDNVNRTYAVQEAPARRRS